MKSDCLHTAIRCSK